MIKRVKIIKPTVVFKDKSTKGKEVKLPKEEKEFKPKNLYSDLVNRFTDLGMEISEARNMANVYSKKSRRKKV